MLVTDYLDFLNFSRLDFKNDATKICGLFHQNIKRKKEITKGRKTIETNRHLPSCVTDELIIY